MPADPQTLYGNQILDALSTEAHEHVSRALERIDLPLGKVVYEAGADPYYVYFPIDAIVSLLYVMEDGASAEISVVGNEGLVGIAVFMGGNSTPSRALVQSTG